MNKLALVPLVFLVLVIAIVLTIMPNIFGSVEATANMTGDVFEPEYTAATGIVQINMTILVVIGFFCLLGGVILLLWFLTR